MVDRSDANYPPSMHPHPVVCEFTPHGLEFDDPVKVTFPLPEGHEGYTYETILWYDSDIEEWVDLAGTVDGDTIYVWVDHFSKFAPAYSDTDGSHHRPVAVADATPKKVSIGETVTLDGSASYDDDAADTLYYRWDYECDGTWDTSWSTDPVSSTSYSTAGVIVVRLEVKDNVTDSAAYSDSDTCKVWVACNSTPTAEFEVVDKRDSYYREETITLDASPSFDEDGDSLEYRWDWQSDGEYDTGWSTDPMASTSYAVGGATYVIRLQVRDGEDARDTDWTSVYIEDQTAIRLDSFTATQTRRGVNVHWVTGCEIGTAGFNLWRSDGGEYVKVNTRLIGAKGGPSMGARYSYMDKSASSASRFRYKLEEIETDGHSNTFGPIEVRRAPDVRIGLEPEFNRTISTHRMEMAPQSMK